jgi:hypothetical protein
MHFTQHLRRAVAGAALVSIALAAPAIAEDAKVLATVDGSEITSA